jgi:hypothetical protein
MRLPSSILRCCSYKWTGLLYSMCNDTRGFVASIFSVFNNIQTTCQMPPRQPASKQSFEAIHKTKEAPHSSCEMSGGASLVFRSSFKSRRYLCSLRNRYLYLGACNIAGFIGERVSDRVDAAVSGAIAFCTKLERRVVGSEFRILNIVCRMTIAICVVRFIGRDGRQYDRRDIRTSSISLHRNVNLLHLVIGRSENRLIDR